MNRPVRQGKWLPPHDISDVLISAEQIRARVDALVLEMLDDCGADDLVVVGILRGSFMFLADLVRGLYEKNVHPRIDFMTLESYGSGTTSRGTVVIRKDITVDVNGADVVLVDDILDSGRTLAFACNLLRSKGAKTVTTCVLLDKPAQRVQDFRADHIGFTVEPYFVVGYGLDYDHYYRELPYIARVAFPEGQGD